MGVIIGKGGDTIKYLQVQSGAKIQVTRDMDADPNSPTRSVEIQGTPEQIAKAEELIAEVLAQVNFFFFFPKFIPLFAYKYDKNWCVNTMLQFPCPLQAPVEQDNSMAGSLITGFFCTYIWPNFCTNWLTIEFHL